MIKSNEDYRQLLEALKARDREAFKNLYRHSRKKIFAVAFLIVKDIETAKDLVQDFFIDFWEHERYQNVNTALQTYLTHSIRNKAINWNKKQEVVARLRQAMDISQPDRVSYAIENKELNKEINKAINNLPPMASKVFEMHYIERLSHNEIAKQLGISKSTISSHLDRAVKELRKTLKKVYKNPNSD